MVNTKRRVCQVVHSLHISSFMEKKAQLAFQKQAIFNGATSEDLITPRGALIIHSCFCFTLRTMFNSSLESEFKFFIQKVFKNPTFVFPYLFKLSLFSFLVVICMCFYFFLLFFVSHMG